MIGRNDVKFRRVVFSRKDFDKQVFGSTRFAYCYSGPYSLRQFCSSEARAKKSVLKSILFSVKKLGHGSEHEISVYHTRPLNKSKGMFGVVYVSL